MNGYTLLSNILVAVIPPLLWVVLIFLIFLFLKKPIIDLINRIRGLKYGSLEVVADIVPPIKLVQIITEPKPREEIAREAVKPLSNDAKAVLSTLWKHQQAYYKDDHTKGRWSFGVIMTGSPFYIKYLRGNCELMERRLVGISPENGQSLLTDEGIEFCKANPEEILTDWDFQRWKAPFS
jgi:hypothetical protein